MHNPSQKWQSAPSLGRGCCDRLHGRRHLHLPVGRGGAEEPILAAIPLAGHREAGVRSSHRHRWEGRREKSRKTNCSASWTCWFFAFSRAATRCTDVRSRNASSSYRKMYCRSARDRFIPRCTAWTSPVGYAPSGRLRTITGGHGTAGSPRLDAANWRKKKARGCSRQMQSPES